MERIKSTNVFISFVQTVRGAPVAFAFLVVSAFSSLYLYNYGLTIVHNEEEARFSTISKELKSLILSRYNRTIDVPIAVRGVYTVKDFSDAEFKNYIQTLDLKNRYPGFLEIGVVKTKGEKNSITPTLSQYATIDGAKGSVITKNNFLTSDNFVTALKEIKQGSKIATALLPNTTQYVVLLPITKDSFLYTVVSPDQVFNRLFLDNSFYGALDFKIIDTSKAVPSVVFDSSGLSEEEYSAGGFTKQEPIVLFDATWTLLVHANEESLLVAAARQLPSFIRVGGVLISFLVFLVLFVLGRSRADAVVLAHQMTKDLKQSEEKYKSIFESLQDVFYRTDKEGNVTTVSPSIYNYIGKTPETLIGKPATDFYKNPNDRAAMIIELQKKGQLKDYPLTLKGPNDKEIFVSLNARFLKNDVGEIVGVEGLLRDVTERKIAEDIAQERTKELERMNSLMIGRELRMVELKKQLAEKESIAVVKIKKHAKKK